jgi:competence protein ComGF
LGYQKEITKYARIADKFCFLDNIEAELAEEKDMLQKEHVEVYLSYSLAKEIISIDNYDSSKSKGGIFSLRFP